MLGENSTQKVKTIGKWLPNIKQSFRHSMYDVNIRVLKTKLMTNFIYRRSSTDKTSSTIAISQIRFRPWLAGAKSHHLPAMTKPSTKLLEVW